MSTSAELYPEIIPSKTLLQVPKKTVAAVVERQFRALHVRFSDLTHEPLQSPLGSGVWLRD